MRGGISAAASAAFLLALSLGGCDQRGDDSSTGELANGTATVAKHYEGPKPEGVSSTQDAVTTTFYIPQASISDMYEIEASELALVRARRPEVKAFAKMMIADHGKSSADLKRFVAENPVNIAPAQQLDARRRAMIVNLEQAGDAEFDREYVGQQSAAHDEAYNLHQSYANRGDYPALKERAKAVAAIVARHREHVKTLDREITGSR
ncbi:MAG: DUF4142 domain-containing protein [Sphingobium sp.]|nr:DUF4142 domain-containing protein [Sphingobium sp.]